ncbi:hypothetical protein J421_0877 [Gemmatirosa kalamazoonensis]|uniref:Uncharacterized protein n=1 Tax=Gemmatirosa kalamazoonensis TaxID=861299 RepID=W0RBD6_9BACT|nr:hypothetical protein [Gemmatirosa kalamazoonensis]AHG88414.1 hypothetical protein J421_0877 [Gemmatirosa kalamazoonensis]
MELSRPALRASPRRRGWTRLSAEVRHAGGDAEELWLEVPDAHAAALATAGDPFLAWLAPLAAVRGEPLRLDAETDRALLDNVREVLRVWRSWYPQLGDVALDAPPRPCAPGAPRTASFFTGGVDSFFTALRHAAGDGTPTSVRIDDLVFVHGFDIPLANDAGFARAAASLERAADAMGKHLVLAATNLRETRFAATDWSKLSHGAALAGVAHALGARYGTVLIGSSAGYRDLRFWGSHPLTDPLFTSSRVRVVHDGPAFMRVEKTEYVARSPIALRHLRVCYQSPTGDNCGRCNGCYRTMLALEALGALDACATFDRAWLDLDQAGRIYCRRDFDVRQFGYVRDLARRCGRPDIEAAMDRSLRDSEKLTRGLARWKRIGHVPLLWRLGKARERRLLRGWIV